MRFRPPIFHRSLVEWVLLSPDASVRQGQPTSRKELSNEDTTEWNEIDTHRCCSCDGFSSPAPDVDGLRTSAGGSHLYRHLQNDQLRDRRDQRHAVFFVTLQSSPGLSLPNWTTIATNTPVTSPWTFIDTNVMATVTQRFYRTFITTQN